MKKMVSFILTTAMVVAGAVALPTPTKASSNYEAFGTATKRGDEIYLTTGYSWQTGEYAYNKEINLSDDVTIEYEICLENTGGTLGDGIWLYFSKEKLTNTNMVLRGFPKWDGIMSIALHTYAAECPADSYHFDINAIKEGDTVNVECCENDTFVDGEWHKVKVAIQNQKKVNVYFDGEQILSTTKISLPKKAYVWWYGYSGGYKANHKIRNVSINSSSVKLSESSLKLELNDSYIVDYAYTGSTGKSASFSSSNTKVAKISSKGKIVAVAAGSATITCNVGGASATCKVIVLPKKISGVKKVSATKNNIKLSWTKQAGVSGYEVWMYDSDLEEYTRVKTVSKDFASATITDLKKGKTYKYMVRAYVKAGSKKYYGEYSNVFSAKTK